MEQGGNQQNQEGQSVQPSSFQSQESSNNVSFPTVGSEKKSGGAKTLLIIGILVLVAILGFVIYKSAGKKSADASLEATPFDDLTTPSSNIDVQPASPTPSSAPLVKVDKTKVKVQVQNGTGVTGEASYLQTQLGTLGYTNIKVGNSDTTTTATTVAFASTLDSGVVSEITQKLNTIYQSVTTSTSTSTAFDLVIVTGLRKGETAKPSSSPKASASPSASLKASPTATPAGL